MALFSYSALDSANIMKEGVVEGVDKGMVARRLMQQGLRPIAIKPYTESKGGISLANLFKRNRVTKKDIEFFTQQISLLLDSGLSLDASLRIMRQNSEKPAFRDFTGQIERKLKEGKSFSQALADYPIFSSMYVNIARAGEEGGILPEMLTKMAEYQATFSELKQFIISASIYPIILLFFGLLAIVILFVKILPTFEVIFKDFNATLPMNAVILMNASKFINEHLLVAAFVLAGPPIALVQYVKSGAGRAQFDRFLTRAPLLSTFVRDLETTRIFRTLQVLVENGVHLAVALKISAGVATNLEYKRVLNRATEALKEGREVGKRIRAESLLPDLAADLLSIGEESGQVGKVCGQIAQHFEKELRTSIKRIIALIEPLFILLIALLAGFVVFTMLQIILSINDIKV